MFRFFRVLRKNMLKQNRVKKYIIYAIGEIILVVIGIFIALQLNIAQQKKEARKTEIEHLQNILSDLNKEVIDVEKIIIAKYDKQKSADNLITYIDGEPVTDLKAFNLDQRVVFVLYNHNPNNNSFTELMNSGQLSLIKNNDIRQAILNLNSQYHSISEIKDHLEFETHEFLYKQNINAIDYDLMFNARNIVELRKKDSLLLLENIKTIQNDKSLKNTYVLMSSNNKYLAFLYKELLVQVKNTIALIESDLSNN